MDDLLIILALILLNGIFSMAEIGVISARKSRLTADARRGSRGARTALRLAGDPDRFLSTIQIGITLIGILTGLFSGAAIADSLGDTMRQWGLPPKTSHTVAQIVIVTVVTYLSIVIGELVPKRIGLAASVSVAKTLSRPMQVLSYVAMPAVWLLSVSTSLITKLIGLRNADNSVTEDEIRSLIKDGTDSGEVKKVEQDIMERALVLGDLRVASIMTPKIDVASLRLDMSAQQVRERLSEELHNSYPVYCDRSLKTVCGVVSLKNLILAIGDPQFRLADAVAEPQYFPESMSVYDALERMKSLGLHFAIVCDEFGDMSGVITPSDILEGLVGAMQQQSAGVPGVTVNDDGSGWTVDGQVSVYDFLSSIGREDLYVPATYSTVGGLVLEHLRHVPMTGERLEWNGITFEIASMDGAKIERIDVSVHSDEDQ